MTRVAPLLRGVGAALIVAVALACSACSLTSDASDEDVVAEVVTAVRAAAPRVTDVTVERSIDGLSSGWAVDVVLDGADPVTPDELGGLLLAIRHAGNSDPGHVDLFATTSSGSVVDLTAPADELGLSYSNISTGIGVVRTAIDDALGEQSD